jgi:hypothetical protein
MIDYVKISIISVVLSIVFGVGYRMGYSKYLDFKKEVEIVAHAQEAKVESIQKQHELVTKGIENEYEAKLSAVRNYYKSTSVWNNSSSGKTSGISAAPTIADVISSYNLLAGQCAETTIQTIALQDWIKAEIGIK